MLREMTAAPQLEQFLAERGVPVTRQRLEVFAALAREDGDLTAQQLWTRLREAGNPIGLATVYRTLALLSEKGVVDAISHHASELCYRLCGEGHHHHLVCAECHRVVELEGCGVATWVEQVSAEHGFVPTEHRVELTGVCADCR
jgi:Fur family ferric uptake transcriptional regulator